MVFGATATACATRGSPSDLQLQLFHTPCFVPLLCRFPPATKAAILVTLGQLIRRAGAGLKPFVPQLQTTFVKCLNDQVGVDLVYMLVVVMALKVCAGSDGCLLVAHKFGGAGLKPFVPQLQTTSEKCLNDQVR
jgi:hypothetical protein